MNSKLLIAGASGQGKVVLDIFQSANAFQEYAFLDDAAALQGQRILGVPVIGTTKDFAACRSKGFDSLFVGIADNKIRERLQALGDEIGLHIPTAIHPSATVSRHSAIGPGTCLMAGAIVNPNTKVGKGCIINTAASIDHDNVLGDFCQIQPGARVTGTVRLGRRVTVGTGAVILPNLTICDDAMIGAGAVITKDVTTTETLVGIPARPLPKGASV